MPELTTVSAISRINLSLTSQPNLFQLFHPMGGVAATPVDCPVAVCGKAPLTSRQNVASRGKAARAWKQHFLAIALFMVTFGLMCRLYSAKTTHLRVFPSLIVSPTAVLPEEPAFSLLFPLKKN